MAKFFSRFFPTPRFLKIPAVGLDISDQAVRFIELLPGGANYTIGRFGEKKIPVGVIESGKIKDAVGLKKVLSSLRAEYKIDFVGISVSEEQTYLARMSLPRLKRSDIRGSIELQIEEHIPLKVGETVFDYEIISENENGYDIEVSALPLALAENYFSLFEDTGLTPLVFEIEAQAMARAILRKGDVSTHMIIDFGETRTGLSIVSGGVVMFTSTLDIGGRSLDIAVQKSLNISPKEAERKKKEHGFLKDPKEKELFFALMQPISVLKDEINKHFVYWHTHLEFGEHERKKIDNIILCGGDSNLLGFSDYLSANLKVPVELANVWTNVCSFDLDIPQITFNDSLHYATSVGLALGGVYEND
ncbi:MAG: pilus assembly protein PilM [Patescibacteria group bacterium]